MDDEPEEITGGDEQAAMETPSESGCAWLCVSLAIGAAITFVLLFLFTLFCD